MLSVCIPVYRYDARPLVSELLRQTGQLEQTVELLVYDDASPDDGDWGRADLRRQAGIRYVELPDNHGRAAIRNRMAREARYDNLLFLDVDGWPGPTYLQDWLVEQMTTLEWDQLHFDYVISGGRAYQRTVPEDFTLQLHWWYGYRRESQSARRRSRHPNLGFQSNNFMVSRTVLQQHPFPESHTGYGHEDTQWAQTLPTTARITHVDNPTVHLGLEPADVFLRKQHEALTNLALLRTSTPHLRTRLTDLADRFPLALRLTKTYKEQTLVDYLTSRPRPNLRALDLLKLKWWQQLRKAR